jgi:transcriptional regulator with XRE-family HTH domain
MHTLDRLGLVVREERATLRLTVDSLAQKSGVSPQFVKQIESNKAPCDISGVLRVLDALGVKALVLPPGLIKVV